MRLSKRTSAFLVMLVLGSVVALGGVNCWTELGPNGGQIFALAGRSPKHQHALGRNDPGRVQATDAGLHWANVFALGGRFAMAIAVHPTAEGTVFVVDRFGLPWRTTDGGTTWTQSSGRALLAFDQQRGTDRLQTGRSVGDVPGPTRGLYRSTDSGSSWGQVKAGASDLVLDPHTPLTLWVLSGGTVSTSTDGGSTWQPLTAGLPSVNWQAAILVADPMSPETAMYAVASEDGGYHLCDIQVRQWGSDVDQ